MTFEELNLNDNILDALWDMNFSDCTPVQEQCIPHILSGRDIIGIAQTGTGKTAAYLLPILNMLDDDKLYPEDERLYPDDAINCVIMSPTRELAQQIDQAMQGFSYYMPEINSVAIYGGNDGNRYNNEQKALSLGANMVIATPGRLISHIQIGNVDFSRVSFFVLDEADRMLDMGFADDIKKIASLLPQNCQTIMFSATMPDKIEELAKTLLHNPVMVKLAVSKPAEKIHQQAYICHEDQKTQILKSLFKAQRLQRVIIFASSKIKCKELRIELLKMKVNCDEMHSDLTQAERDEVMFRFKSGQSDVLVATDIVARGIDIDDIAMVINYDVPHDVEDYVHRIGRTARADRDGEAITLVRGYDIGYFMQIEKFLERSIEKIPLPDGLEGPEYKPIKGKPKKSGRGGRGKGKPRKTQNNQRRSKNGVSKKPKSPKKSTKE
ncbi:MAG: DEAD/DEAH box helicase [Prevotella sp.]|nr:DEAD/DEAH box helicase [Prevotella sp.]